MVRGGHDEGMENTVGLWEGGGLGESKKISKGGGETKGNSEGRKKGVRGGSEGKIKKEENEAS